MHLDATRARGNREAAHALDAEFVTPWGMCVSIKALARWAARTNELLDFIGAREYKRLNFKIRQILGIVI